jgi:TP901 family phage tail tape measure protein
MAVDKTTIEYEFTVRDATGKPLVQVKKNADAAQASLKQLGESGGMAFSKMQSSMIAFNQGLDLLGRATQFASSTFEGMFRSSIDLEKGIASISTLFDSTAQSTALLTQQIVSLQRRFGSEQKDITSSYYEAIASGAVQVSDAMSFMIDAEKLAIGGMTSLKTAVSGLTSLISSYGLSAKDAGKINDALFIGAAAGKTNIDELASSLGSAAAMAKASGVTYQEYIAAVSALTAGGVGTSEAVTQVQSTMTALTKQTTELTDTLYKLGIGSIQTEITQNGLVNTLNKVMGSTDGTTETLTKLFGRIEAVNGVLALTGSTIGPKYKSIMKDMGKASNEAGVVTDKAFGKMANTVSFKLDQLKGRMETVFIKSNISAMLKPLIDAANELITVFERLQSAINGIDFKKLANDLVSLSIAIGMVTLAVKSFAVYKSAGTLAIAAEYIAGMTLIMIENAGKLAWAAGKWLAIAAAIGIAVASIDIFIRNVDNLGNLWRMVAAGFMDGLLRIQRALLATFVWIEKLATGIVGLFSKVGLASADQVKAREDEVARLSEEYGKLSEQIDKADTTLKETASKVDLGFFGDIFTTAMKALNDYNKGLDKTGDKLKGLGKDVVVPPPPPVVKQKFEMPQLIPTEGIKLIGATFGNVTANFASSMSGIFSTAVMGFAGAANIILDAVKAILEFIPNIVNKVADIFNMIADIPTKILDAFKNLNKSFSNVIENFLTNFSTAMLESFDVLESLMDSIPQSLYKMLDKLPDIFTKAALYFVRAVHTHIPRLVAFYIGFVLHDLPKIIKLIIKAIGEALPMIWKGIVDDFKKLINQFAAAFNLKAPFKIDAAPAEKALKKLGASVEKSASDVFAVVDLVASGRGMDVADRIRSAIDSSVTRAKNVFTKLWNELETIWRRIWDETVKAYTKVWDTIVNIWRKTWEVTINSLTTTWDTIVKVWDFTWGVTVKSATTTWDLIVKAWDFTWAVTIAAASKSWETISAVWDFTWTTTVKSASATWELITAIWKLVWEGSISSTTKSWDSIVTVWKAIWDGTVTAVTNTWAWIADKMSNLKMPEMPEIKTPAWLDDFRGLISKLESIRIPGLSTGGVVIPSTSNMLNKAASSYQRSDAGKVLTTVGKRLGFSTGGGVVPQGKWLDGKLYAAGGASVNQGTDVVPAQLTPGEFVVNREAARYNLGLLSFINKAKAPVSPVAATSNISVIINAKTDLSPEQIKREVIPTLEKELKRKSQDGKFMLATSGLRTNK